MQRRKDAQRNTVSLSHAVGPDQQLKMLNRIVGVQVSDTTGDDSSKAAKYILRQAQDDTLGQAQGVT